VRNQLISASAMKFLQQAAVGTGASSSGYRRSFVRLDVYCLIFPFTDSTKTEPPQPSVKACSQHMNSTELNWSSLTGVLNTFFQVEVSKAVQINDMFGNGQGCRGYKDPRGDAKCRKWGGLKRYFRLIKNPHRIPMGL